MKVTFDKPFMYEGVEYKELNVNIDQLTGRDLIEAEKEARLLGDVPGVAELSKTYLACVAAKAAKKPVEFIMSLPVRQFTAVTMKVQDFLL